MKTKKQLKRKWDKIVKETLEDTGYKKKQVKFQHPPMKKGSKFTHWIRPVMTGYHLECCDCGLVHTINFQAIKITKRMKPPLHKYIELNKKDYQVEMKIRRNEKLTKLQRIK